jgi:hypothetical protein
MFTELKNSNKVFSKNRHAQTRPSGATDRQTLKSCWYPHSTADKVVVGGAVRKWWAELAELKISEKLFHTGDIFIF